MPSFFACAPGSQIPAGLCSRYLKRLPDCDAGCGGNDSPAALHSPLLARPPDDRSVIPHLVQPLISRPSLGLFWGVYLGRVVMQGGREVASGPACTSSRYPTGKFAVFNMCTCLAVGAGCLARLRLRPRYHINDATGEFICYGSFFLLSSGQK
jgi:hypothetical protein